VNRYRKPDGRRVLFLCATWLLLWVNPGLVGSPGPVDLASAPGEPGRGAVQKGDPSNAQGAAPNPSSILAKLEGDLAEGQTEMARGALQELLQQPALKADDLLAAGVNLAQHDLYDEAARAFSRCVKDYPDLFEGYYNLALTELALGKIPEAFNSIDRAPQDTHEKEIMRSYLRGKIEAAGGRPAEAERDLLVAFRAAPQEENYVIDMGLFYLKQQSYPKAIAVFQTGATTVPSSIFVLFGLSLAQFLGGQPSESIRTCDKVLKLDKDFPTARTLLAFVLCMQGRYQDAMQAAEAGLSSGQSFPYLYYVHALAEIKLQSKDYDVMLRDLTFASKNIPACSLCYLSQSKVHQSMGRRDEATADLEEAVRLDPSLAEAWYRLASLYQQAGRHDDALRARAQFEKLKAEKSNKDTEIIRNAFIDAMEGSH